MIRRERLAAVRAHLDGSAARALSEARARAHAAEVAADGLAAELADARARIAELETNRAAWPAVVGDRTLLGAILARLVLDPAADAGRGVWRLAVPAAVREAWVARHSSAAAGSGVEPLRRCEPSDEGIPAAIFGRDGRGRGLGAGGVNRGGGVEREVVTRAAESHGDGLRGSSAHPSEARTLSGRFRA